MRIRLLCVGKPREPLAAGLHDDYVQRLERLGIRYDAESVAEVKPGGRYSAEHVLEREGRALLERVQAKETVVALNQRGDLISSRTLAERIERWATPRATLIALLDRVKADDDARQQFVDILELMGPHDPRTADYRKQLTARLF